MKDIILKIKSDLNEILSKETHEITIIYVLLTACVLCSGVAAVVTAEPSIFENDSHELTDVNHYIKGTATEDIDASYSLSKVNFSQETKSEIRNRRNAQKSKPIEISQKVFNNLGEDGYDIALVEDNSMYVVELNSYNNWNDSTSVKFLVYGHLFFIFLLFLGAFFLENIDKNSWGSKPYRDCVSLLFKFLYPTSYIIFLLYL